LPQCRQLRAPIRLTRGDGAAEREEEEEEKEEEALEAEDAGEDSIGLESIAVPAPSGDRRGQAFLDLDLDKGRAIVSGCVCMPKAEQHGAIASPD